MISPLGYLPSCLLFLLCSCLCSLSPPTITYTLRSVDSMETPCLRIPPQKRQFVYAYLSLLTSLKSNHQFNYTITTKMSPSPSDIPAPLVHIVASISALINLLSTAFHKIPGSPIIIRYIRSSYQNDPWRSLLEVLLVAFALRTVLKGRTRGDGQSKSFIKFSNKVSRLETSEARLGSL